MTLSGQPEFCEPGFYLGMLGEHFQVCRFGVESDFWVGPVTEGFVAGATTSGQGSEDFAVKVDKVGTVLGGLDLCMHDPFAY